MVHFVLLEDYLQFTGGFWLAGSCHLDAETLAATVFVNGHMQFALWPGRPLAPLIMNTSVMANNTMIITILITSYIDITMKTCNDQCMQGIRICVVVYKI